MSTKTRIPRWLKWEFWPYHIFYIPVSFLFIIHAFRSRSLAYITLSNPGMRMGGFSNYSKYDILRQLAPKFLPRTVLFQSAPTLELLKQQMQQEGISYPVILKPNQGERGWKVEKISNETQLIKYLNDAPERLMLQEYIDLPEEYGIMYYRFPGHATGTISSVMKQQFLTETLRLMVAQFC